MTTLKKLILENTKLSKKYQIQGGLDDTDQKRSDEIDELIRPLKSKILKYIGFKGIKDLPIPDRKKLIELLDSGKMTTEKEVDKEFKKLSNENYKTVSKEAYKLQKKWDDISKKQDMIYTNKQSKLVKKENEIMQSRLSKELNKITDLLTEDLPEEDALKLVDRVNENDIYSVEIMKKEISKIMKKAIKGKKENESDSDEEKELTKAQKISLIKKIPDGVYTEKQIHKIVDAIKQGVVTRVSGFPTPTKGGVKVEIEFVKKSDILKN